MAGAYYLRSYRSGRELYAIGSNPDAARLAGIPIAKRIFTAFVISGGIAGVAGVLYASRYGTIDSTAGTGYELNVIAAVVVGGVAIFGGSGSAIGAALGALLLNTIISALYVLGVSPYWDRALTGLLLLAAITLDRGVQLYLVSALYHALPEGKVKAFLNRVDHAAIYLFIAGSYTPFALGVLHGRWGWMLFGAVWAMAAAGTVPSMRRWRSSREVPAVGTMAYR